jgi:hypothetical protein
VVCSCNKNNVDDDALEGEWILTDVSCFCYFEEDYDFTTNKIIFDTENSQIAVESDSRFNLLKESGTYSYSGKKNEIYFDNDKKLRYTFSIEGFELTLIYQDDPDYLDDEISYIYRKK